MMYSINQNARSINASQELNTALWGYWKWGNTRNIGKPGETSGIMGKHGKTWGNMRKHAEKWVKVGKRGKIGEAWGNI